ncbi:MAG: thioredoxin family protein [Micromonospora sp.]
MREPSLTGLVVVVVVLAAATAFGWWRRRRDGRFRPVDASREQGASSAEATALAALGVPPGVVTLVQFSAPVCAPCRATRRILEDVRGTLDGIALVEVDVEERLDLARELDVWRTPTVLVVDAAGRIVQRASGVPARDEIISAITPLLAGARR